MARKIFLIVSVLLAVFFAFTVYNSVLNHGEYVSSSKSFFLIGIFVLSIVGLFLGVYKDEDPSYRVLIVLMFYALIAFVLWLEGALIV